MILFTIITAIVFFVLFIAASTSDSRMAIKVLKVANERMALAKDHEKQIDRAIQMLKEKEAYLTELEQHILNRVKAGQ